MRKSSDQGLSSGPWGCATRQGGGRPPQRRGRSRRPLNNVRRWKVVGRGCPSSCPCSPFLRRRLEEVPNLVGGVDVPVGIAQQAEVVHGGMRDAVAAASDGVEREAALAGRGP